MAVWLSPAVAAIAAAMSACESRRVSEIAAGSLDTTREATRIAAAELEASRRAAKPYFTLESANVVALESSRIPWSFGRIPELADPAERERQRGLRAAGRPRELQLVFRNTGGRPAIAIRTTWELFERNHVWQPSEEHPIQLPKHAVAGDGVGADIGAGGAITPSVEILRPYHRYAALRLGYEDDEGAGGEPERECQLFVFNITDTEDGETAVLAGGSVVTALAPQMSVSKGCIPRTWLERARVR